MKINITVPIVNQNTGRKLALFLYPEEQIVMGSLSYQNSGDCFEQIKKISEAYNIGGVFNWEYFDVNPKGNEWANNMDLILNKTKKK